MVWQELSCDVSEVSIPCWILLLFIFALCNVSLVLEQVGLWEWEDSRVILVQFGLSLMRGWNFVCDGN